MVLYEQDGLERILREHLERRFRVTVELGVELLGFEQTEDHVVVRLKNHAGDQQEEIVRAKYLIGTDGGRSTVRKGLGLDFEGDKRLEPLIYGDAAIRGLDDQVRADAYRRSRRSVLTMSEQYWHRFESSPGKLSVGSSYKASWG
jgi:2-polyprenyl-6-methoxyphenol hydroxylase-like FAD-dependent oxidoreductase